MTGKEKCAFLRSLRKAAAEKYGIDMEFPECTHQGECSGTCPACEKELDELNAAIDAIRGKKNNTAAEKDELKEAVEKTIDGLSGNSRYFRRPLRTARGQSDYMGDVQSNNDGDKGEGFREVCIMNTGEGRGEDIGKIAEDILEPILNHKAADGEEPEKQPDEPDGEPEQPAAEKAPDNLPDGGEDSVSSKAFAGKRQSHIARFLADDSSCGDEETEDADYGSLSEKLELLLSHETPSVRRLFEKLFDRLRDFIVISDEDIDKMIEEAEEGENSEGGKAKRTSHLARFLADDSSGDDDETENAGGGSLGEKPDALLSHETPSVRRFYEKLLGRLRDFITAGGDDVEGYLIDDETDEEPVDTEDPAEEPDDTEDDESGDSAVCSMMGRPRAAWDDEENHDFDNDSPAYYVMGELSAAPEDDDEDGESVDDGEDDNG